MIQLGLSLDAVVKSSFVLSGNTGETVGMRKVDASGSAKTFRICNILVELKFVNGTVRAAVIDDPVDDMILGCRYLYFGDPSLVAAVSTIAMAKREVEVFICG